MIGNLSDAGGALVLGRRSGDQATVIDTALRGAFALADESRSPRWTFVASTIDARQTSRGLLTERSCNSIADKAQSLSQIHCWTL